MSNDVMGIDELAVYLQRDAREVSKMASRGYLPGQKIGGEWRFHPAEINHWIETQMAKYTEQELTAVERGVWHGRREPDALLVTPLISEATVGLPLKGSTRSSVLKELVELAEQSWHVWDPQAILGAVTQREEAASTALPCGVALPHPHRPLPNSLGGDVVAYGRHLRGIPFGGEHGGLTDTFFLVCCQDHRTQLQVLARLSRMLLRPTFLDELRSAETPGEVLELLERTEVDL